MEEDSPPPLPKRPPTIIRPAPVPKAGDAAPHLNGKDNKAAPVIPSRPAPPRPVPNTAPKISAAKAVSAVSSDSKNQSLSGKSNVNNTSRRKLEITVLDARPMSEIGFRDIIKAPATDNQANPKAPSAQGKSLHLAPDSIKSEDKKEETLPATKAVPPRPLRPSGTPTQSLPTSSLSDLQPVQDERRDITQSNTTGSNQELTKENKSDEGDTSPPKPKRPTIIRPQSKLLKQQAVTSVDSEPGDKDKEKKPTPPPLPSALPSATPKVPPLPSRPPVAPPTAAVPASAPASRPLPPKPDALPQPQSPPHPVRPAPRPKPRPRSTIIVPSNSMFEIFSTDEGIDVKSDPKASSVQDDINVKSHTDADIPARPKRPTIIRPKSMALPSNTQVLSFENSPSRIEDSPSSISSPSIPARPQRPSAPKKIPTRPVAPPAKAASVCLQDQPKEDKPESPEEPVYCRIVKPLPQSTNDEQDILKSTEEKILGTVTTEEEPPPLPPKLKPPVSIPVSKPLPQPKPKPKTKPKPKPKPFGVKSAEDLTEVAVDQVSLGTESGSKSKPETPSTENSTQKEKLHDIPQNDDCEKNNHEELKNADGPKHISPAFLSRFESKEIKPSDKKEDRLQSDLLNQNKSVTTIAESIPPLRAQKPMTILGRNEAEEKGNSSCVEENDTKSAALCIDGSAQKSVDNNPPPPPPPKRPLTIIGRPQRASQESTSFEPDSSNVIVKEEEAEKVHKEGERISSENDKPIKPSRPPQVSRPPPPTRQLHKTTDPSSEHEDDQRVPTESSSPNLDASTEPGVTSPVKQIPTDLNQNVAEISVEADNSEEVAPPRPAPPRPSGPPVSLVPPGGNKDQNKRDKSEGSHSVLSQLEEEKVENVMALSSEMVLHDPESNAGSVKDVDEGNESLAPAPRPPRPASVVLRKTSDTNLGTTDSTLKEKRPPRPDSAVPRKASYSNVETDVKPPRPAPSVPIRNVSDGIEGDTEQQPSETRAPERPKPPRPQSMKSPTVPTTMPNTTGPPQLPPRPAPGHTLYHYLANQSHGIASHDYTATQPDELSFKAGDVILVSKEMNAEWLAGSLGDAEGIFPRDFIELKCPVREEESSERDIQFSQQDGENVSNFGVDFTQTATDEKPDNLTGPRCRARFDFEGEGEGELAIEDGDVIQLLSHMGPEWMKGELNEQVGIFPSAFVEIIEDLSVAEEEINTNQVSAMFDFDGQEGELSFQAGDAIEVKSQVNLEWLFGETGGRTGKFPAAFVSHVPPTLPQFVVSQEGPLHMDDSEAVEDIAEPASHSNKDCNIVKAVIRYCKAIHDYDSNTPGDLMFKSGDRLEIVEFVGEDWLLGRCKEEEGLFPVTYVKMEDEEEENEGEEDCKDPNDPAPPAHDLDPPEHPCAIALHDFEGETSSDLSFKAGDKIELHDFVDASQEWRWGICHGITGMFPAAFVELC